MESMYESNPILDKLPNHLKQFIKAQNYDAYTPVDQAVWRYVMRKNVDYLSKVAHGSYMDGLIKTGISLNHIPNMYGMNRILKEIGWAAVAVDGFIPPSAFMEFQAYNVLVIASDIRQLKNIEYTPAPDIIHEGAGHAPIIANPEYAEYLRRFGEIGSKAISSAKDYELYQAVRHLSIIKEAKDTPQEEIAKAEMHIMDLQQNMGAPSEMALIRNLHWWTVEYGLIGTVENPKIYGAGLLSSIGESEWCMKKEVIKLPFTIEAALMTFDITKPQPQLFVTPNFAHLSQVLEDFANTMALRTGGLSGIQKLIDSKALGSIELSTGIQISGHFHDVIQHNREPVYIRTVGPTALAYRGKELVGHGAQQHTHGFGLPVGKLKGINLAIEDMGPRDLKAYKIYEGEQVSLEFEGDLKISGTIVTGTRNLQGKIVLITLTNCTVTHDGKLLFLPEWGQYHMAVGQQVVSAFNGPADLHSFDLLSHELSGKDKKIKPNKERQQLESLYKQTREYREDSVSSISIGELFKKVKEAHPNDWLLPVELLELAFAQHDSKLQAKITTHLDRIKQNEPMIGHLIDDGIKLIKDRMVKI